MLTSRIFTAGTLFLILVPQFAFAMSLHQLFGYLDIFIGLFLTISIVMFAGALLTYFTRYGTPRRAEVFPYMEWSIAIVFVLIVLLALIHFFQKHTNTALYILGGILFILFVALWISVASKKEEKPATPPR